MASIVIRIVKRDDPDQVAEARGELEGAGFTVTSDEADSVGIDTRAYGGTRKIYGDAVVLVGRINIRSATRHVVTVTSRPVAQ